MKTLTLNVTTTVSTIFTVPVSNDTYTALLTMSADGASDEEFWEFMEEHVDDTCPIEDYQTDMVNAVTIVNDGKGNTTIVNTTTEGTQA